MKKEELKNRAVDIKGKKYVLVSDRVLYFNEEYKNGSIITERLSENDDRVVFRATITPDVSNPTRTFVAHSQASWGEGYINKTSALENAETSAVGRALGMLGIGVLDSIASADEIHKAVNTEKASTEMGNCPQCGAPNKISKAGKKYCSKLCWKNQPTAEPILPERQKFIDELTYEN